MMMRVRYAVLGAAILVACHAFSAGSYVADAPERGAFALSSSGRPAGFCASSGDHPGVLRVLDLLRDDVGRVTGAEPSVVRDTLPRSKRFVLVGTLGRNPWIERLVREKKLNVEDVRGKWETFLIQPVEDPFPGIEQVLVIVGSDKRGTIYGMFDLSSNIGVSPWYWWADVAPRKQSNLYVLPGRHVSGEPKVKYRGIFINDEAPALTGWAKERYGGFNHRFYEKVFELILRLKGNYLWPAMWGSAFADDDPENPRLANEYGVVMGTSHHEPMMRAHDEWRRYGSGPWNYAKNDSALREFWRQGIRRMGSNESIVTIGMRGDGDEPMSEQADIALLERIVRDQRTILAEETGKDPTGIPQVWALYKEVQEYYDRGMRVPDDVTLLLSDDNWGNLRKLPPPAEGGRSGGYGIYYHLDYVGGPRNYQWLNTVQIARVWEQMHLAYEYGARQIWIVNVGDIKPLELPIQFFLDYAWNPESWTASRLPEYTRRWAEQQFGPRHAGEIAEILTKYTTYNSRRKPELLSPDTYSLTHYREAETVAGDYDRLAERARALEGFIPAELGDAYYELVLHPVLACANLNRLYVTVGANRLSAGQGRAATNRLAAHAWSLFEKDSALSYRYNRVVAEGKWNHMMDQTHIGYTTWQQPDRNVMPRVDTIDVPDEPAMGVAAEGSARWWPGDTLRQRLPDFDRYNRQTHFIDIFNRGKGKFRYSAVPGKDWITLRPAEGVVAEELRLQASVDWGRAPEGRSEIPITISGPHGARVVVSAVVVNPPDGRVRGFMESDGYVSIEAEHYSRAVNTPPVFWQKIPDLGRTLSGMTPMPVRVGPRVPGGVNPCLEYRIHVLTSGEVKVHAYFSPTRDLFGGSRGGRLRYGISFDGEKTQILEVNGGDTVPDWKYSIRWMEGVSDNIRIVTSRHFLSGAGEHILKFWMVDPAVVLQKLVVETRALKASYLGPPESYHSPRHGEEVSEGFSNPVLAGFYPDPSACRVGKDYYLVNSTFSYFPGIPLFHSRDLVHWTLIGHVLDRPGQLNLEGQGVSRGLFAPSIRYHEGIFYVTCTLVDIGGNFVVTARDPRGPWSDPVWIPEVNGIDPSLFFDNDGKSYLLYNSVAPEDRPLYSGHRTIRMRAFDTKTLRVGGDEWILVNGGTDIARKPAWIEGPHLFREGENYFLLTAEGGTGDQHSEVVFRARSVTGPYEPYAGNPILTQRDLDPSRAAPVTSAGHADLVRTEDGAWWAVFLACRPYGDAYYNTGRETFLAPVRWDRGWPVITARGEEIAYRYPFPVPPERASQAPYSGNFIVRDEFRALSPDWIFLRTPHEQWFDLSARKGSVGLKLRPETCSGTMNPSFLGRRQQHLHGAASASMVFTPMAEHEKAGMLIFQNETHFYFLCKSLSSHGPVVQLYRSSDTTGSGAHMELLASRPLAGPGSALRLKIEAHGDTYAFLYASGGEWQTLREEDARFLSTRVAGGFVGCMYALYATSLGEPSEAVAYFDWFEYAGDDEIFGAQRR